MKLARCNSRLFFIERVQIIFFKVNQPIVNAVQRKYFRNVALCNK